MIAPMDDERVARWQRVVSDEVLLKHAAGVDPSNVAAVESLRKYATAEHIAVALELCGARAKAVHKFGPAIAAGLIADAAGVEQASASTVAQYKAIRMREALGAGSQIADLCCGVGGDSMAMCDAGLDVLAVDHDALRAWMAVQNTGERSRGVCADVAELALGGMAIHLDPARRDETTGKRARGLEGYQPGPDVIGQLIEQAPAAAVKLSPAVDIAELTWPGEVEFISDHGRLVQAVLWTGGFMGAARQATLLDDAGVHTLSGEPIGTRLTVMQRYLYTFDPAVERAELIGQLSQAVGAGVVHPRLGLLTSDRVIESPWLTGFELIEQLPWRPKRVRQWLGGNDAGLVEVKTRGKACDPDSEQRHLRGKGDTTYTVFVLRFDTKVRALITRRM